MLLIAFSALCGMMGAWFMARYAYRFGLLDIPNDRSSHTLPTPRGGGVGILMAFVISSLFLDLPFLFWVPPTLLALVSFFDDKLDLSPRIRLFFQFGMALIAASFTFHSFEVFLSQNFTMLMLCSIVIVGTANFYNFMDGINGVAGITGAVAFALMGFFAYSSGDATIVLSTCCVSAACIGFLPFNLPRARVFMGDVGSVLLGFLFVCFVLVLARDITDFMVLSGFLAPFYADTLTTLYIRKRDREQLSKAHRRHLYQLFANQMSVPHWKVSVLYGLIQAGFGVLLLLMRPYGLLAVIVLELCMAALWLVVMNRIRNKVEASYGKLVGPYDCQ